MTPPPKLRPGSSESGRSSATSLAEPSVGQILIAILAVLLVLALALSIALG